MGTFARPLATGNQVITHDMGSTPRALVLITASRTALDSQGTIPFVVDDAQQADFDWCMGFYDGTAQGCMAASHARGSAAGCGGTSLAKYRSDWGSLLSIIHVGLNVSCVAYQPQEVAVCTATAWDSTTFTLNWSVVNANFAGYVHYIIFGDDPVAGLTVQGKVVDWTVPATATTKAVTGIGFMPHCLLHLWQGTTSSYESGNNSFVTFGVSTPGAIGVTTSGQWALWSTAQPGFGTSFNARMQAEGINNAAKSYAHNTGASPGPISAAAELESLDADGFTMDFSAVTGSASKHVFTLCLRGFSCKADSFSRPLSTTTQTIGSLGFTPSAVLLASYMRDAEPDVAEGQAWGLGGFDGTSKFFAGFHVIYDSTIPAGVLQSTSKVFNVLNAASVGTADSVVFAADSFDIAWTYVAGVATEMCYLAFGYASVEKDVQPNWENLQQFFADRETPYEILEQCPPYVPVYSCTGTPADGSTPAADPSSPSFTALSDPSPATVVCE